ncbi:MAG TPA: hypothetical protein VFQ91_18925 [Bryobacteraceae bacterium]|nr:hypothetical protein [Bryobacteraceae bacterium]
MKVYLCGLVIFLAACAGKPEAPPKKAPPLPKITHFYGNQPVVPKGASLTLCYGTENVDSLTLTPYDEGDIRPSFNRCVSHTPMQDTTYKLTATGPGGETSASFSVRVGAPEPKAAAGKERVLIQNFVVVGNLPVQPNSRVQLCYTTEGANSLSMQPPAAGKLEPGNNQCTIVTPARSTDYILTAKAPDGSVDRMKVSVPVQ